MKTLHFNARTTEVGDTAHRLYELFKKSVSVQNDVFLTQIFEEVKEKTTTLTSAVRKDTAISQLEKADKERDNAIRILNKLLKGYEHIPLENLQIHAKKLIAIFNKYGVKITTENYASQSILIMSMLDDFSAENLRTSIEALAGVKESIAEIKAKQMAFAQIRETYEGALATQKEKATATSLRKHLLELINKKIIPYLAAMNIAQTEVYKEFIGKATEIINSTNEAVKTRGKK